jgi:pyruvate/2-oxoglutarate dehydrogenase complex dihydrolipoamide acyltransferase (E2) component
MKIINFLILLLAIPPAILSTIQLLDTTLPVVSPIYNSIVETATEKVLQVTHQQPAASESAASGGAARAPAPSPAAQEAAPATESAGETDSMSLRWVHLGVAAVSILIAIAMFLGLRRRAPA